MITRNPKTRRLAEALFRRQNEGGRHAHRELGSMDPSVQQEYERDAMVLMDAITDPPTLPTEDLRNEIDVACPRCGAVEVLRLDVAHVGCGGGALKVLQFRSTAVDHTCGVTWVRVP